MVVFGGVEWGKGLLCSHRKLHHLPGGELHEIGRGPASDRPKEEEWEPERTTICFSVQMVLKDVGIGV